MPVGNDAEIESTKANAGSRPRPDTKARRPATNPAYTCPARQSEAEDFRGRLLPQSPAFAAGAGKRQRIRAQQPAEQRKGFLPAVGAKTKHALRPAAFARQTVGRPPAEYHGNASGE